MLKYSLFVAGYLLTIAGVVWTLLMVLTDKLSSERPKGMFKAIMIGVACIATGATLLVYSEEL